MDAGGDASAVQASLHDVVRVYGNIKAFAAVTAIGGVATWQCVSYGGNIPAGKLAAWCQEVEALLTSGVHTICANDVAFSAIKTDGKVVAWGHTVTVPVAGVQFTSAHMSAAVVC